MYLAMYHKGVAVTSPILVFIISVAKAIKQNNDGIRLKAGADTPSYRVGRSSAVSGQKYAYDYR